MKNKINIKENKLKKKLINKINETLTDFKDLTYDSKKRVYFLFGSGINFNLSNNAVNWDGLVKLAVKEKMFNYHKKDYVADAVSKFIIKEFPNNKLALTYARDEINFDLIKIDRSKEFTKNFGADIYDIRKRFITYFITLNYDELLEEALDLQGENALDLKIEDDIQQDLIYHLHGIWIKSEKVISDKNLLGLEDYVNNAEEAKEILKKIIIPEKKEKAKRLVVIIGTSLAEEHIISAFKEIKQKYDQKENPINIIYFSYGTSSSDVNDEIEKVYNNKLKIKLINYRISNNISKDFEFLWKKFVKILSGKSFNKPNVSIASEEISLKKLYKWIKKPKKSITYKEVKNNAYFQKFSNDRKKDFLNRSFNTSSNANEYIMALLDDLNLFSVMPYFYWNKINKNLFRKLIRKVNNEYLKQNNRLIKSYDEFLNFIFEGIKELNEEKYIKKYKWNAKLMNQLFFYQLTITIRSNAFNYDAIINPSNINWNIEDIDKNWIIDLPGKNHFLINVLDNHIEKIPFLKDYKDFSQKNLIKFAEKEFLKKSWFFNILFTKRWKKKWNEIINFVEEKLVNSKLEVSYKSKYFLIYYLLLTATKQKVRLKEKAAKLKWVYEYPEAWYYVGTSTPSSPKLSELDGLMIEKDPSNIEYFQNIDEAYQKINELNIKDYLRKREFINRMQKIEFPSKSKIDDQKHFIKIFNKIWEKLYEQSFLFMKKLFKKEYYIKLDNIKNFIALQLIINSERGKKSFECHTYPIKIQLDEQIKNNFINKIKEKYLNPDKNKISKEEITQLYFLQNNNVIFVNAHMIYTWWFELLQKLPDGDDEKEKIKQELQDKYKFNKQQIICLLDQTPQFFNPSNWDDIYILHSRFKIQTIRNNIEPQQLAKIIWKPYKIANFYNSQIIIRDYFYANLSKKLSEGSIIKLINDMISVKETYKNTKNNKIKNLYKIVNKTIERMSIFLMVTKLSPKILKENTDIIKISRNLVINMVVDFSDDELSCYDENIALIYEKSTKNNNYHFNFRNSIRLLSKKKFGTKFKEIIKMEIRNLKNIYKDIYFDKKSVKDLITKNKIIFEDSEQKDIDLWLEKD